MVFSPLLTVTSPIRIVPVMLICAGLAACGGPNLSLTRETPVPVVNAPLRQAVVPIPPSGKVTVTSGDTVYILAARYQVSPDSIIRDNGLNAPYTIRVGQSLTISPPRVHVVRAGDTIFGISQRYAVSQYQLAQTNGLSDPFELFVGQRLILPSSLDFSVLESAPSNAATAVAVQKAEAKIAAQAATPTEEPVTQKRFVAPASGGVFNWPLQGEVIAEFGPAARGVHNDGVNIAAAFGTPVNSTAVGTVAFVGRNVKSFGTLILVKHDGGIISAYAHLEDVTVSEGDIVTAGQQIGTVGQSGKADSPQLHFEIRKDRQPLDPRAVIS